MRIGSLSLALMLGIVPLAHADIAYDISLNTAALIGHAAGPFSLNFQLNDGSGGGDGNNTATLSNFQFGGGSAAGAPSVSGGASGALSGAVTFTDTGFLNSFTQEWNAGSLLSFRLNLTTNVDPGPTPDEFSFAILDNLGFEIPTGGVATVGSDVFLLIDITSANPVVQTFRSDPSRAAFAGGNEIDMAAPVVVSASVPEPGSWLLLGTIAIGLAGRLWRAHRGAELRR
jgi:hypothetical protein